MSPTKSITIISFFTPPQCSGYQDFKISRHKRISEDFVERYEDVLMPTYDILKTLLDKIMDESTYICYTYLSDVHYHEFDITHD